MGQGGVLSEVTPATGSRRSCGSLDMKPQNDKPHHASYATLGLRPLLRRIVEKADTLALTELLKRRRVFQWGRGSRFLLSQFLAELRETAVAGGGSQSLEMADWACDYTLDKFSPLPQTEERAGPDCRYSRQASAEKWPPSRQLTGQTQFEPLCL